MAKSLLSPVYFSLALGCALYNLGLWAETATETKVEQVAQPQGEQISINETTAEQLSAVTNGFCLKRHRPLSVIAISMVLLPPSSS